MFSSAVRASLVALVASAVAVTAAPGLSLTLSGANKVDGIQNLKVTTTITNTGDETLKLLNDPRGPLNKFPTESFAISHEESGAAPAFTGARVKYVPATAVKIASPTTFTVLAPGESASVEHDLSAAYNFTSSGEGSYSITAVNRFHYVHPETNEPVELFAEHPAAHTSAVSGKLAVARSRNTRRASHAACTSTQKSEISSAASGAQTYAANAYSYLNSHTATSARFTTWFGTYSSSHHSTVLSHFSHLNSGSYAGFTYDCSCTEADTYAYTYPDEYGLVYLCGAFWQAPNTGTDSRAGTLIHESTHFTTNGGTEDYAYGQTAAKSLAKSQSSEAIMNADNHEYFAENNPSLA